MRKFKSAFLSFVLLVFGTNTFAQTSGHAMPKPHPAPTAGSKIGDAAIGEVEFVHGMAGPFAVAGYRIGKRAMNELGLIRGSFAVEVTHDAPAEVQWSCIVDGLQAATGASLGKLNLRLNQATEANVRSVVRDRESNAEITFRLSDSFLKRFFNVPVANLETAGREVLSLSDTDIFTMEVTNQGTRRNPFKRRAQSNSDKPAQ